MKHTMIRLLAPILVLLLLGDVPAGALTSPEKPGDLLWQHMNETEKGGISLGSENREIWGSRQPEDDPIRQLDVILYSDGLRLGDLGAVGTLADGTV